jgi:glycosyltransferase involved in cell wall biosynthesis
MTLKEERQPLTIQFFVNFAHAQGTYFRFHNLAIGLRRLGHKVTIYAADHDRRVHTHWEQRDGLSYHIIPETPILRRVFGSNGDPLLILRRLARHYPPCHIAHLFQPFPGAAIPWLLSRAGARFYDWDDLWSGGFFERPKGIKIRWSAFATKFFEQRLPKWADQVTTISHFLRDRALARGAITATVLNSGSWMSNGPFDQKAARKILGLQDDALYVGFMGRTSAELQWCFDALSENIDRYPKLRFAICGPPASVLDGLSTRVRDRVDFLGQLTPEQAKRFAGSIDLGLLPMGPSKFNQSRLPQKFGDHLASGVPLLCSTVGECGFLIARFPWAIPAGTSFAEWRAAFAEALNRLSRNEIPKFDSAVFHENLSWDVICQGLEALYYRALSTVNSDVLTAMLARDQRPLRPFSREES